jgi:hypothetical protein
MRRAILALCPVLVILIAVGATASGDPTRGGAGMKTPAARPSAAPRVSATVTNRFFPLAKVDRTVLSGRETDPETHKSYRIRVDSRVLKRKRTIGGMRVTVVSARDYENGEVVEHTLDYYAQRADGTVIYVGEDIDDIENGKVVSHKGQWRAGRNGATAGVFMPARPRVGQTFQQEKAPRVAEDKSTIEAVGVRVRTPAGTFRNCIRTKDFSPLDSVVEHKHYCPGVGLVREHEPGSLANLVLYK